MNLEREKLTLFTRSFDIVVVRVMVVDDGRLVSPAKGDVVLCVMSHFKQALALWLARQVLSRTGKATKIQNSAAIRARESLAWVNFSCRQLAVSWRVLRP